MSHFNVPAESYMSSPVHSIAVGESLEAAAERLAEFGLSSLAVVDDDGRLVGVISRTDLLRVGRRQAGSRPDAAVLTLPDKKVERRMSTETVTLDPGGTLAEAARAMVDRRVHRVYVTDEGRPVGVVSTRDVTRAIAEKRLNKPVSEFMSSPLFTVRDSDPLSLATERLEKARVTGLVVVEDDWPVGLFTQVEALESKDRPRTTPVEEVMSPRLLCLDGDTRMHRAASQAAALGVRRVVVVGDRRGHGILSGLDFARAAAG